MRLTRRGACFVECKSGRNVEGGGFVEFIKVFATLRQDIVWNLYRVFLAIGHSSDRIRGLAGRRQGYTIIW